MACSWPQRFRDTVFLMESWGVKGRGVEDFQGVQLGMFWLAWKDADLKSWPEGEAGKLFLFQYPWWVFREAFPFTHRDLDLMTTSILSKCWLLSTYFPFCFSSWTQTIEIFLLFLGNTTNQNTVHLDIPPCCDTAPQLSRQNGHFH